MSLLARLLQFYAFYPANILLSLFGVSYPTFTTGGCSNFIHHGFCKHLAVWLEITIIKVLTTLNTYFFIIYFRVFVFRTAKIVSQKVSVSETYWKIWSHPWGSHNTVLRKLGLFIICFNFKLVLYFKHGLHFSNGWHAPKRNYDVTRIFWRIRIFFHT